MIKNSLKRQIIIYSNTIEMPNYQQPAIIYTIRCKDPNVPLLYVGATFNFRNRKYNHKSRCNNGKSKIHNLKVYKMIRDNGGWDNFVMKEYAKFQCNDKVELNIEEERVRVMLEGNMNSNKAYTELKGNEYCAQYNLEHKEETAERMKQNYQCSCGGKYSYYNRANRLETKKHLKHLKHTTA